MNEGASETHIEEASEEGDPDSTVQRFISDVSNVFSTTWIRYAVPNDDGNDGFILGSRRNFLLYFRLLLVGIYITYETLK
jgi:hypothetical protein